MPIEEVRKAYEATVETMKKKFPIPEISPGLVEDSRKRMSPLSYSLDVAWRQQMQSFREGFNDPTRQFDTRKDDLVEAVDRISKQGLDRALKDWLVEADPFKESQDQEAISKSGAKLLKVIQNSSDIAAEWPETAGIQADLVAIADGVRMRLSAFERNERPNSPAVSVPHQMYLELRGAIEGSKQFPRDRAREAMKGRPPREVQRGVELWDKRVQEKFDWMAKDPKHPLFQWSVACEDVLSKLDKNTSPDRDAVTRMFERRKFQEQMNTLNNTINGDKDAKDYVMKVREAAWPVQETVDLYLHWIESAWRGTPQDEDRVTLQQHLCAVDDWLLKQVNFVITSQLARSGSGQ